MVSKNELRVGVKFETDNQQLDLSKQKLNELLSDLQKIQTQYKQASLLDNASEELKQASQEAKKLEQILNSSWNSKLGQLDIGKFNAELRQSNMSIEQVKSSLTGAGTAGTSAFNNIASSILNANLELKKSSALLDKMALTMANTIRFGISSSIFNSMTGAISKAYGYAVDLDSSLNNIRIVSGQSAEQMEQFAKYANQAAKELGASTLDYTDASLIYYQQGLADEEVTKRTEITLKAANALNTSAQEVSEYMTAIWNNFDDGSQSLEYYADVITALGASTASSAAEIAQGLEKFAAAANTVGLSYEYATSALATVVAATRQSADTVGTAFKTLFARLQDLNLGKTLEDGTDLGKYSQALEKVGITIKDQNGQLKQMDEILNEMGAKWNTLNKDQQVALAQNVAGVRQYTQLVALMDNWDQFTENIETATGATGTLQKQQETYMQSVEAHLQKMGTEAERTYDILFDTDTVNGFADSITNVIKIFNNLISGVGGGAQAFLYLGSTIANVFSNQIGGAISKQIQNIEIAKKNAEGLDLKDKIASMYVAQGETGVDPESVRIEKEAEIYKEISAIKDNISQEEYNQLLAMQKQMGITEEKLAYYKEYKTIALDILDAEDATLEEFKDRKKEEEDLLNDEKLILSNLQKTIKIHNDLKDSTQKQKDFLIAQENLWNQIDNIKTNSLLTDQESAVLDGILEEHLDGEKFSEEEILKIQEYQNLVIQRQQELVDKVTQGLRGKQAAEEGTTKQLEASQQRMQGVLEQTKQQSNYSKNIQTAVKGATALVSLFTSLSGIVKTLNDDSLSAGEKAERVITTLLASLPMIISNFSAIKKMIPAINAALPKLLVQFGLVATEEEAVAMSATKMWTSILGPIAMVITAVAAVVYTIKSLIDMYNADAEAAKRAAETAEELNNVYEETKQKAKELKNTISDYSDAIEQMNNLKEGTQEYADKLTLANEKAKELINQYQLFDKVHMENGAIKFDQGVLEELQQSADLATLKTEANKYNALIAANSAQLVSNKTNLSRKIQPVYDDTLYTENKVTFASKEMVGAISDALTKLKSEDLLGYNEVTSNSGKFAEWVRSLDTSNEDLQKLSESIGKQVKSFVELTDKTNQYAKAQEFYINQIQQTSILEKYGEQIRAIASKDEEGNIKESDVKQIAAAISETGTSNYIEQQKASTREQVNSLISLLPILGGEFLNNANKKYSDAIKTQTQGEIDLQLDTDEDLAKAYAKHVMQLSDIEISALQYADGILSDAEGKTKIDVSSGDKRGNIRQQLASTVLTQYADQQIDTTSSESMQNVVSLFENLRSTVKENSSQFGIDMSEAITSSLTAEGNKIDMTQFYDKLKPDQVESMKIIAEDPEQLKEFLGLTDDLINQVGLTTADNMMSSFVEGLDNYQFDAASHIKAALSGKDDELEKQGLKTEELGNYAEYLMDIAKNADIAQDNIDDLADSMETNADSAVVVAKSIMRMNSGIEKLLDNQEDWIDKLRDSKNYSEEYYDALNDIRDAMGDLLDLSEETEKYLDGDFFVKNADLIAKAAEGDAEAIDALRNASTDAIVVKILMENEFTPEQINVFSAYLQDLQNTIPDVIVGTELDLTGMTDAENDFWSKCQNIIDAAQMTASQAKAFFESMGFDAEFEVESQPVEKKGRGIRTVQEMKGEMEVTMPDGTTRTVPAGWETKTYPGEEYSYVDYVDTFALSTKEGSSPNIKKLTKKATGASNNYSSSNKGGGSSGKKSSGGGGGGGSKTKEPDKMDPLEEEADRYHEINTQIQKVDNSLKKLTSQEQKFVGVKLIENLNSQWALLNTQIENYNKKLKIAQQEQEELKNKLTGKGVKYNSDGTISNYMEAFAAQQNYVNSLVSNYNSMSAEEQEKYKETVEQAKEDFKEFQKDLDRYDTLVSNEIPGLTQSIQDALDEQIEINIKKFNMEVDITLNIADAERNWNKWKAKVLDDIKESDILGNAQARLQDFSSYYDNAAAGSIQVQTRHLEDTLTELRKMDQGLDNVYGDNRSQALEDLKKYYEQLMEDLEGVLDLQTEIHQAYLDMMDEAQDKFKEQLDTYEMIGDLLNNNMKVVQLIYGEEAYNQLGNYYQQQYDNNVAQLDFLRQQKQLWAEQMEIFEQGSDEWNSAKDKWMDAAKDLSSTLVSSLETARQSFENVVKEIFQDLNNIVTDNLGLSYVKEEWELINRNADEYLDTINAIAGIRGLEAKYIESINQSNNAKNQQRLNALMESELNTLRSMDKISQADLDRAELKYQIALAQIALEDAQQKKTQMRLRRDTQGNYAYQYTADEEMINKAKEELSNLYVDLYNFDKDKYKENLDQIYSVWDEYQQKMAEAALINDPELRAQRELLIEEQYSELLNALLEKNIEFRSNLQESSFMSLSQLYQEDLDNFTNLVESERNGLLNEVGGAFNTLLEVYGINTEEFKQMTIEEQNAIINNLGNAFTRLTGFYNEDKENFNKLVDANRNILVTKMVPQWTSSIQTMADKISGNGGLQKITEASMNKIKEATAKYDKQVEILSNTAGKTTTEIGKGLDKDITKTQQLLKDNDKLITSYDNELKAVKRVCDQIDQLINKYSKAETAAKNATEAAYKYWLQDQKQQTQESKQQSKTTSNSGTGSSASGASSTSTGTVIPASPQGNGQVDVGDKVTLNGKLALSSYNTPNLTPLAQYRGAQLYVQMINNGAKAPYHLGTTQKYSASTAVGWVDKNQISGYDTGGYTGDWSANNGKLAFLHQKELVLNAQDTENMLNTVAIMRSLATTLGGNVLAKLAGVSAGNGKTSVNSNDIIEQNVHIDATFPGVKDAKEIEDALNNLVNSATQRVFKKR